MYAVGRLSSYISQGVYTVSAPFHPFGGAVDIIVVQQQDGSFKSSPWYVKFGKFQGVLKTKEKIVNININGVDADFSMYLDHKGEAYFLKDLDGEECESTSSSSDDTDGKSQNGRIRNSKSYAFDAKQPNLNAQIDVGSGTIVTRTNSRRSKIFGLMFGRKSMKEDSMQREGSDHDTVNRVSSLERAEIAADLLDVKWSTNLSNDIPNKDKVSRLSTMDVSAQDIDKDLQVNDKEIQNNILLDDCLDNYFDNSDFQKATGVSHEQATNSSGLSIGNGKCSNGASSPGAPRARSEKLDESMMEASVSGEKFEVVPETSAGSGVFIDFAERDNDSISEIIVPCVENPHLSRLDGHPGMQQDMKCVPDEWVQSFTVAIPNEESGNFYIYSETPESSKVDFDVSDEKGIVTFDCSCGECEVTLDKLVSRPEWASVIDELRVSNNEDSGEFSNTKATCLSKGSSISADTKSTVTESHCSYDIHLLTSEYGEAGMLKIIHPETMTERLTEDKDSDTKSVVGFEELSRTPGSHVQVVSVNQLLHSVDEAEQQGICISSSISNLISLVQEEKYLGEENELNTLHNANSLDGDPRGSSVEHILTKTINAPPESSGDDQFLFSDNDDFKVSGVRYDYSGLSDSMDRKYDPLVSMYSIQELQGSNDLNFESDMTSVKHFQECSLTSEHVIEESRSTSSPMSIPKSRKSDVDEVEWMIESLPIFRSHINDLERSNLFHSLSQSLDSRSENSKWGVVGKDIISSSKSVSDTEQHLTEEDLTVDDIRTWEELKNMSPDSTVEISLCKHLLYEGMGADAASLAFEAEKLDLEKFVSLGPGIVKSDKLIVRIGSQYFPWDAAAPIILGMITFGEDQIVPEGMISVDQVNNTGEGEQSRAAVPSGGSWRLWPFNFKRASTINSVQPAPESIIVSASANASESSNNVTENNTPQKVKVARKNVKSLVPTSEQLATLNLKDGQNVVTFTFSTAMLGKQQVDARIYLWKWNTRIVISDVDGTITKSDVLGQFMPLVGKDWSQTGVAHLFSAIKENGYQLLFLSARAISQAYLTRQFLFNLKQDGKALPDGPVVISPDGLFPSLYREVIRRAPHEFKIACLKDIKDLFPPDCNPFYAGFGNRDTDEFSYLKVGIPKGKIFIINAKGEVSVNRRVDRKSYTSLHALVNGMFPATSSAEQEEFNSWNYWRTPLPDIDF